MTFQAQMTYAAENYPEDTDGICKSRVHKAECPRITELANGYCMRCWDTGRGGALTQNGLLKLKQKNKKKEAD